MQDVRVCLEVKNVRWEIEKRVVERIFHVVHIDNDRLTKTMVLALYQGLKGKKNKMGKKRKTLMYWE